MRRILSRRTSPLGACAASAISTLTASAEVRRVLDVLQDPTRMLLGLDRDPPVAGAGEEGKVKVPGFLSRIVQHGALGDLASCAVHIDALRDDSAYKILQAMAFGSALLLSGVDECRDVDQQVAQSRGSSWKADREGRDTERTFKGSRESGGRTDCFIRNRFGIGS